MWQDPIIKETRERRAQYAAELKYDADAIFDDICKRQKESGRKRVVFPPRNPHLRRNIA